MARKQGGRGGLPAPPSLYGRVREILESARAGVARSVNTTQVVANWLVLQFYQVYPDLDAQSGILYAPRRESEMSGSHLLRREVEEFGRKEAKD